MRATLFSISLATVFFMLGRVLPDHPGQPWWVWDLCFAILVVCIAGILIVTWIDRRRGRRESKVGLADRWETEQQHRRYEKQLDAFWKSLPGRWIHKAPFLANDSVRIESIQRGQTPKTYLGLLTLQIDDTYVAYVQTVVPSRWNNRVMRFVTSLARHRILPIWAWDWLGKRLRVIIS